MPHWSTEADAILASRYPTEGASRALQATLNRSSSCIRARAILHQIRYIDPRLFGYGEVSGDYMSSVRASAASRELAYDITAQEVDAIFKRQGQRCAYCGRLISFKDRTASIDRIDSTRGYTNDNIQIVHKAVNRMKLAMTHDEFIALVHRIYDTHEKTVVS